MRYTSDTYVYINREEIHLVYRKCLVQNIEEIYCNVSYQNLG